MNHGSLGLIEHNLATRQLSVLVPMDILRVLSIENGNQVEGVYRLSTTERRRDENRIPTTQNEFIFSPIPFRLWPKVARIRICIREDQPLGIAYFAILLAEEKISIVHSEFTRSTEYFFTWNLVVVLDVEVGDDDFDPNIGTFRKTIDTLGEAELKCGNLLYSGNLVLPLWSPIKIWPLTSLAYFYFASRCSQKDQEASWLFEPFALECRKNAMLPVDSRFPAILGKLIGSLENNAFKRIYADVSSTEVTLRIVLIPETEESRFAEIEVDFERTAAPDTSRGFCSYITEMLPPSFRVWKLTNFTKESHPYSEIGGAKLLIEDVTERNERGLRTSEAVRSLLDDINTATYRQDFNVKAYDTGITNEGIRKSIIADWVADSRTDYEFDVFLSYSSINEKIAEKIREKLAEANLRCYMAKKQLRRDQGVDFADRIRDAIIESREMAVLCSPESVGNEWVMTEWGAAWALKKRVTPVLYRLDVADLPDRLRRLQVVDFHDIAEYVLGVLGRRDEADLSHNKRRQA